VIKGDGLTYIPYAANACPISCNKVITRELNKKANWAAMRKLIIITMAFLNGKVLLLKDIEMILKKKFLPRIKKAKGITGIIDLVKKDAAKTIVKTIIASMIELLNSSKKNPLTRLNEEFNPDRGFLNNIEESLFIN